MKSGPIGHRGVATAALGVLVLALFYVQTHKPLVGRAAEPVAATTSSDRVSRRANAETLIAKTQVVTELEVELGEAFGGVWFKPSTAELRVGVTSQAGRRLAEAITTRLGLYRIVRPVLVGSSWEQLESTQRRWGSLLGEVLEPGMATTWISASHNQVGVELASTVPDSERITLERRAAGSEANVAIVSSQHTNLFGTPAARCAKFVSKAAFCNPTIVAGVRIESAKGATCSAGPAVILKDRTKFFAATNTYLLTAGHCMSGGQAGELWYSKNKEGHKTAIGKAQEYKHAASDIGLIHVEQPYWANESFIPVAPGVAQWEAAESEPVPIVGESTPVEKMKTCFSGQVTGTNCGTIAKTKVTVPFAVGTETINLVEVTGFTVQNGDSGGTWVSGEEGGTGLAEGTLVGDGKTGNPVYQPLGYSFESLNTKVELLTEVNEERHEFKFDFGSTPTVLTGKKTGAAKHVLTTDAAAVSCNEVSFTKTVTTKPVGELAIEPKFAECTTGAGAEASIDMNGCDFRLLPGAFESENYEGKVNITCPLEKAINVTVPGCLVTIRSQVEVGKVTYTPTGSGSTSQITVDFNLSKLAYEEHHKCPQHSCADNTKEKNNGSYTGAEAISGETGAGAHVGVFVSLTG